MSVVNYRGKRDEFRIFISVTEDGRRRRITEIVHGSKRDALARETQIKAELALETHVEASRQTVRQFESDWWSTKAASLSPTTAHRYRGLLDLHILAALGEIRIQKVRASHIAAIVRRLVEDEKHRTAKNVHVLVKQLFKAALEAGLVVRNPVATVHAPKVVQREMTTLTPEEAVRILDYLTSRESWATMPITILLMTAIRRSELVGLRWADLDRKRRTLTIQRSVHYLPGGRMVVRPPKTARGRRTVALDGDTAAALDVYRAECKRRAEMFGQKLKRTDYMFARADGSPWPGDSYTRLWVRMMKRLGIQARLYDLRHTSASLMLAAGVNARLISERLGHADVGFTLSTYTHLLPNAQADAAELLSALLETGRQQPETAPAAD